MVQQQLIEYVSSELKAGIARSAVKSALIGAGWMEVDVEDTLKKIEASAQPAASISSPSAASGSSIKVSDLVSASGASLRPMFTASPAAPASQKTAVLEKPKDTMGTADKKSFPAGASPAGGMPARGTIVAKSSGGGIMKVVAIAVILIFAGAAGYLYYMNMGLSSQLSSLNGQSGNVTSQLASLNAQVESMTASTAALETQIASLTAQNSALAANLSFSVVPPLSAKTLAPETLSISGTVSGSKSSYQLDTPYGVTVFILKSSDPKVDAALKPLLGVANGAKLTGSHVPGSQYLTVTAVNGVPLSAPAASSTSASTPTSQATTTAH